MQVLTTALCPPHRYLSSSERETVLNTALNAFQSVDFSEGDLLHASAHHGVLASPQVLNAFQSVDFSEGDLLFREGDPGVSFILIREGEVIAIECL
jgi:hypothetical protein